MLRASKAGSYYVAISLVLILSCSRSYHAALMAIDEARVFIADAIFDRHGSRCPRVSAHKPGTIDDTVKVD